MIEKKHGINISQIRSNKARNIMRGIIGVDDGYKVKKALEKIRVTCGSSASNSSLEVVRGSVLFESNHVTRYFSNTCLIGIPWIGGSTDEEIIFIINSHKEKIKSIMQLYARLITEIQNYQFKESLGTCREIIEQAGVSCFFIRVLYFMKNRAEANEGYSELSNAIDVLFVRIKLSNVKYLDNAIWELSNPLTDYFNICGKISGHVEERPLNYIAKSFITHVIKEEGEFSKTLNSFLSFSLIDSFMFYVSTSRLCLPLTSEINKINKGLIKSFDLLRYININFSLYPDIATDGLDISFYRESFLLIELETCFKYKTIHGSFYNRLGSKEEDRLPLERKLINTYFNHVSSLNNLRSIGNKTYRVNLKKYTNEYCNYLENSSALVFYLEMSDADISNYEELFVKLMSCTMDVGYICPLQYFYKIKNTALSHEVKLVVECLISINNQSQSSEHDLRRLIQIIVIDKYSSKLLDLLKHVYEISISVTAHLLQICDETFLSKLFRLVSRPNQAIELRAEMLEWYGLETKNIDYVQRAKNLRIDVQISKEKGTIDDSRIYVDPLKYTQWVNDNIINQLTFLLENSDPGIVLTNKSIKWDSVNTGISNLEQISSLLLNCYGEFCNNNIFGIASFLGRRIRHGTFKGTALNDIREFRKKSEYSNLFDDKEFDEYYCNWLSVYENMLDELKSSYLHINRREKPNGLIYSGLNTASKRNNANYLVAEIIGSYSKHNSNAELPYLITEYNWRFIEEDLSNIRKVLMKNKSKYAVFSYDVGCESTKRRNVQKFSNDLNSVAAEKFRIISSWFTKPSFAAPSAELELLFKAVVSEIRGFFNDFDPDIVLVEGNVSITGGQYFVIYDALYILIYNAAKYGKKDGQLEFINHFDSESKVFNMSLSSQLLDHRYMNECKNLIDSALNEDFEDAHINEGRSGIKKLKRMESDKYIRNVAYKYSSSVVTASFDFELDY